MRKAASISARAHRHAMQICKPGLYEYQIAAEFDYEFRKSNAVHAYSAIVGGGVNGCILHYTDNGDLLNDGDLLLIDSGCEVEGYASDITRTFPVNGKYSTAQREIYEIVLAAQKAGMNVIYLDRSNTKKGKFIISSLSEVKKIIEDINQNQ